MSGAEIGSPGVRRALGAAALALGLAILAWPVARSRLLPERSKATPILATRDLEARPLTDARASVAHLQVASAALAEAANEALTSRLPGTPTAGGAGACFESLVPQGTFGAGRLEWVCEQADAWQLQLDLYGRVVARGSGRGVPLWVQLGHFELGAIAILRSACCPNAPALVASVPTDKCGSPSETLAALGRDPSPEHVERYADTMQCLASRKVWFPEAWARVPRKESRRIFDDFLEDARPELEKRAARSAAAHRGGELR